MTTEDILALEGRELDGSIAPLEGWSGIFTEDGWLYGYREPDKLQAVPRYHSSLDAIRPVLDKAVEEFGEQKVRAALVGVTRCNPVISERCEFWRATARDQARAIVVLYARRDISTSAKATEEEVSTQ